MSASGGFVELTPAAGSPARIDPDRQRYPYSVVWGPLPCLTCCCPCVGHMGIGDSQGRIHDFVGYHAIGIDCFMVGSVWRYAVVEGGEAGGWDEGIQRADAKYRQEAHNICCNNCHHHTADALSYGGREHGLLSSWWLCCWRGRCTWCQACCPDPRTQPEYAPGRAHDSTAG